jgi:hypothetical protein
MPCQRITSSSLLLFVLIVPLAACSSTERLSEGLISRSAVINAQGARQTARITLADGRQVSASAFRVSPDSASWVDSSTGNATRVPTADVVRVKFTNRGRAALQGAGIGLAVGAIGGAMSLAVGYFYGPLAMKMVIAQGAAGAGLGAAVGSRRSYQTAHPPAPPSGVIAAGDRDPE